MGWNMVWIEKKWGSTLPFFVFWGVGVFKKRKLPEDGLQCIITRRGDWHVLGIICTTTSNPPTRSGFEARSERQNQKVATAGPRPDGGFVWWWHHRQIYDLINKTYSIYIYIHIICVSFDLCSKFFHLCRFKLKSSLSGERRPVPAANWRSVLGIASKDRRDFLHAVFFFLVFFHVGFFVWVCWLTVTNCFHFFWFWFCFLGN